MKKITITIELGNDEMKTDRDVANALRALADRVRQNGLEKVTRVMDGNGNTVGKVEVS